MTKRFLCFLILLSVLTGNAYSLSADEIPVIANQTKIARGKSRIFEFGTVPQQNTTVLLEITSRLDSRELAGSSFFLRLVLNGREVNAAKSRTAVRLKNRAFISPVVPDVPAPWFGSPDGWRVLYAPDFEGARKQTFYEGDPYTLVLDVTDLTNPMSENRLEITNTAEASVTTHSFTEADLVIDKLTIKTLPQPSLMMSAEQNIKPFINRGERAGGPAKYKGQLLSGGGFSVTVGEREWKFASAFSYPNAGFNRLDAAPVVNRTGQPDWNVQTQNSANSSQVVAQAREYSINRRVKFTPRKIEVFDAITNKTNAPLGLMVRHETTLDGLESPPVRLAGSTDPSLSEYHSPGNPSVHITAPGHTLAMLCEDDVLRNQARLYIREGNANTPQTAGIRTDSLRLGPGETYEMQWSVYPVASPDYFDFINLVRQDWGANFTIEGACWWGFEPDYVLNMPLEELSTRLNHLGIRFGTIGGGWVDKPKDRKRIGFGAGVMDSYWDDYRRRVREAGDKLRLAVPGFKVLAYYDSLRDTTEGGKEKFRDSWITDAQGNLLSTEWGGQFSLTHSMFATLENSYGKAMLETARRYMDEMKLDGIYWDEMENVGYSAPLITYNVPDGRTAIIDPQTYTIQREIGNTALLGEEHRLAVIDMVQKRGGILLGNSPAGTKRLLKTGIQRMVESIHNDYWMYEGHLGSPLGFIGSYTSWEHYRRNLSMAALPVTIGIHQSHDLLRHMFPFTPIELHFGYLLGQERIITLHNGNYGWDGKFRYRMWVYDGTGKVVNENPEWQQGENRIPIQVPENGVVVMERQMG